MCIPDKHFVTTTETAFNPVEPVLTKIHVEDILNALSNNCRWGGHVPSFYSVAQHTCCVLRVAEQIMKEPLPRDEVKQILLHDASEAYLIDIPAPIKKQMPEYMAIEDRLQEAIARRFDVRYPWDPLVHVADKVSMVAVEANACGKRHAYFPYFLQTPPYCNWIEYLNEHPINPLYYFPWTAGFAKDVLRKEFEKANIR